jgi:hypothetical protein
MTQADLFAFKFRQAAACASPATTEQASDEKFGSWREKWSTHQKWDF